MIIKINKVTRALTLPPIVTGLTVLLLYQFTGSISHTDFIVSEFCFLLVPIMAYPVREIFHIGEDRRQGQRNTALIFSAVGYLIGFIYGMFFSQSIIIKILFSSYIISIISLILINKLTKYKASGHACSSTTPTVLLTWLISPLMIIPCIILIAGIYISSLKLQRHTIIELITGSAISFLAVFLASGLFMR